MTLAAPRHLTAARAAPSNSRARCVKVAAVHQAKNAPAFIASAAAALLLCSPVQQVVAAPASFNPAFELANPPIAKNADRMGEKSDPTVEGKRRNAPNTAQGAPPAKSRPAAYAEALRTGKAQTNSPCPTGKLPCY